MPKKRIHKDRSTDTRPKTRNRVECNCTLHCNGSKWVDPRTFERHQQEIERFRTITSVPQSTSQFRSSMSSSVDVGSSSTSKRRRKQEEEEEEGQDSSNSSYSDSDESNQTDYQEQINIPTKRKRYPKFHQTELIPDDENLNNDSDDNDSSDDNGGGSDDNGGSSDDNGGGSDDNDGLNDNSDNNEDLIITNLIQRMMIVVLAMMMSRSNNSLLPILMILILNQMMNIPIRTLNSMILGYYYGFLSIRQDFISRMLP